MSYRVGIDLGGTNIVAGVVDDEYNIIAKAACKTNVPRPETEICDSMAAIVKEAVKKAKLKMDDIDYIGIGVPGAVNPETRIIETSPNLFFKNWEIAKMMEERLHKYTKVENDANAAALGEFLAGRLAQRGRHHPRHRRGRRHHHRRQDLLRLQLCRRRARSYGHRQGRQRVRLRQKGLLGGIRLGYRADQHDQRSHPQRKGGVLLYAPPRGRRHRQRQRKDRL